MQWFGINIDNHISLTKISLVGFAFAVGGIASMSFTNQVNYSVSTDSVENYKAGFKSLFTNSRFDASKPYEVQLNPKAVSFVQEYIRKQGEELDKMKKWGKPYFDLYDNILGSYGIPKEMKYLSVIESHLSSGLVSWAGAVGPWQLMPDEAERFGLRMGEVDDRMDYYKSTRVAAKLMKELYGEFGDWLLVVAAYNGGAGRLRQAIRKSGSREFWDLQYYLPEETRNHVKKFIGTHYAFEGTGGWTTLTASEIKAFKEASSENTENKLTADELANTSLVELNGRFNSQIIIKSLQMDPLRFNRWNPGIDKALAEGSKYYMRIPKDKVERFEERRGNLLMESVKALLEGATLASR